MRTIQADDSLGEVAIQRAHPHCPKCTYAFADHEARATLAPVSLTCPVCDWRGSGVFWIRQQLGLADPL